MRYWRSIDKKIQSPFFFWGPFKQTQTVRMRLFPTNTPQFCVTELGLTWAQIYWNTPKSGPTEVPVKSTATTPSLAEAAPQELRQRSALRCRRAPPQIPACPKALPPPACTGSSGTFWHLWAWLSLGQTPWSLWNTRRPWVAKLTSQNSCYRSLCREGSTCPSHPSWNIQAQGMTPVFPLKPYPLPVTLYCDFWFVSSSGPTDISQGLPVLALNTNPACCT